MIVFLLLVVILIILIRLLRVKRTKHLRAVSLSQIDDMDGIAFEHYVRDLLNFQGYSANVTSSSNDYGVDIVAKKDGHSYAIQVKRYSGNVSRTAVSDSVAGMKFYRCSKAMVITNSYFSKGAKELAYVNACVLVDRTTLGKWIYSSQGNDLGDLGPISFPKQQTASPRSIGISEKRGAGSYDHPEWEVRTSVTEKSSKVIKKIESESDEKIMVRIKKDYPRDPEMQEYEFKQQMSSKSYMMEATDIEIRILAHQEYPTDYTMQEDEYRRQLLSKNYMSEVVDTEVKAIAQREYPQDYISQENEYRQQLSSKNFMKSLPDSNKKRKAEIEYPDDYVMQEYEYKEN